MVFKFKYFSYKQTKLLTNEKNRLNYPKQKRRVVYEGSRTRSTTLTPQRNLVIAWEQQPTVVKKGN
jgi:hypothetical protein